jgi:hypothetical protein
MVGRWSPYAAIGPAFDLSVPADAGSANAEHFPRRLVETFELPNLSIEADAVIQRYFS